MSNFANNIFKGTHKVKCKYKHSDKKCESCGNKYKYCGWFLKTNSKDDLIEHKCLHSDKNYQHNLDEKLKENFF